MSDDEEMSMTMSKIENQKEIWKEYEEIGTIGMGAFGKVFKAKDRKTGEYLAIKELDKARFRDSDRYLREAEVMKILNCESIVRLIKTFETEENYYLIMELCLINLDEYLKLRNSGLSVDEVRILLTELNIAIKQFLDKDIVHRDLKLSNILLNLKEINKISVKISDFGLSQECKKKKENELNLSLVGTPTTMAPEVLRGERMGRKSDVYSLGMIIYYMIFREYPYEGNTEYLIVKSLEHGIKLKKVNHKLLDDLLSKMTRDENSRIGWAEYLNHPFFKEDNIKKSNVINNNVLNNNINNNNNNINNNNNNINNNNNNNNNNIAYPDFNLNCSQHKNKNSSYCSNCKKNVCENCLNDHKGHKILSFSEIGFSKNEINELNTLINDIDKKINNLISLKENLEIFKEKIKSKNDNSEIYQNDTANNFKLNIKNSLKLLSEKITIKENTPFFELIKLSFSKKMNIQSIKYAKKNTISKHENTIFSMDCFPNGDLVSVSGDQYIKIYDNTFKIKQEIKNAHTDSISYVSIKDNNSFVTCSDDKSIIIWNNKNNKFTKGQNIKNAHSDLISKVFFCNNGRIISSAFDKKIIIWETKNNKYEKSVTFENDFEVKSFLYYENEKILISSGDITKINQIIDMKKKKEIKVFDNIKCYENNSLTKIDDDNFGIGSVDTIYIISIINKSVIKEINVGFKNLRIYGILDKGLLFVGGDDTHIKIYRNDNFTEMQNINDACKKGICGFIQMRNGFVCSFGKDNNFVVWG